MSDPSKPHLAFLWRRKLLRRKLLRRKLLLAFLLASYLALIATSLVYWLVDKRDRGTQSPWKKIWVAYWRPQELLYSIPLALLTLVFPVCLLVGFGLAIWNEGKGRLVSLIGGTAFHTCVVIAATIISSCGVDTRHRRFICTAIAYGLATVVGIVLLGCFWDERDGDKLPLSHCGLECGLTLALVLFQTMSGGSAGLHDDGSVVDIEEITTIETTHASQRPLPSQQEMSVFLNNNSSPPGTIPTVQPEPAPESYAPVECTHDVCQISLQEMADILLKELPARFVDTLLPLIVTAPYKLDWRAPSREAEELSRGLPLTFQNYSARTRGIVLLGIQCLLRAFNTLLEEVEQDEWSHLCAEHDCLRLTQEVECLGAIAFYFKLQDSQAPRHCCKHDIEYLETSIMKILGRAEFNEACALVAASKKEGSFVLVGNGSYK